jgi:hypothetical protein
MREEQRRRHSGRSLWSPGYLHKIGGELMQSSGIWCRNMN